MDAGLAWPWRSRPGWAGSRSPLVRWCGRALRRRSVTYGDDSVAMGITDLWVRGSGDGDGHGQVVQRVGKQPSHSPARCGNVLADLLAEQRAVSPVPPRDVAVWAQTWSPTWFPPSPRQTNSCTKDVIDPGCRPPPWWMFHGFRPSSRGATLSPDERPGRRPAEADDCGECTRHRGHSGGDARLRS